MVAIGQYDVVLARLSDGGFAEAVELLRQVQEDLTAFRGAALVKDDQTLLAIDFAGETVKTA